MTEDKFSLKWTSFQKNVSEALSTLRSDTYFVDVTLACEDGQQFGAHKIMLATASPFFMSLLQNIQHPHPIIFMRGMKSQLLSSLIDLLYTGEANIAEEDLEEFCTYVEKFQVRGLQEVFYTLRNKKYLQDPLEKKEENQVNIVLKEEIMAPEIRKLDEAIQSMMERNINRTKGDRNRNEWKCKVCGKIGMKANIVPHIEAKHIKVNMYHSCFQCNVQFRTRNMLAKHLSKCFTKSESHSSDDKIY